MKVKTSNLIGRALDHAVAKCEGIKLLAGKTHTVLEDGFTPYNPSSDWAEGGQIIERESIGTRTSSMTGELAWEATIPSEDDDLTRRESPALRNHEYGPTPLIAALRCYVASKLGEEVEVPDQLA